jgi:hypothetical protein
MKTRILPLLPFLLCFHAAAPAAEPPDYIRYAEDAASARLEVAIRTFTLPSGQQVDLIGVVHIADEAYYQDLNRRFDAYDSVLFELVGDPDSLARLSTLTDAQRQQQSGGALSFVQQSMGQYLNLKFQLDFIDYGKKNMVHADATAEQFAQMQQERGENMLTLFGRAMEAQMKRDFDPRKKNELNTFALIRILMSEDSATEFKKVLAKDFDQMEALTAEMEARQESVILGGRNAVALNKMKEVLANKKQRRIAVFYGGAHMPGIETALLRDFAAKAAGEVWLAAWTIPKPAKAKAGEARKPPSGTNPAP